ncbi:Poly [ADP-ribose] polymerase 1 [Irineochytrium annulatum]|nr:Poly [ADP-ribose] polymerase 1 [Irineochytrium annulatum]
MSAFRFCLKRKEKFQNIVEIMLADPTLDTARAFKDAITENASSIAIRLIKERAVFGIGKANGLNGNSNGGGHYKIYSQLLHLLLYCYRRKPLADDDELPVDRSKTTPIEETLMDLVLDAAKEEKTFSAVGMLSELSEGVQWDDELTKQGFGTVGGINVLHAAIIGGNTGLRSKLTSLLSHEDRSRIVDLMAVGDTISKRTPLHHLAIFGFQRRSAWALAWLKGLVGADAVKKLVDLRDAEGKTPLYYVVLVEESIGVIMPSYGKLKPLLDAGADPLSADKEGRSVVSWVAFCGEGFESVLQDVKRTIPAGKHAAFDALVKKGVELRSNYQRLANGVSMEGMAKALQEKRDLEKRMKEARKKLANAEAERQRKHATDLDIPVDPRFGNSAYRVLVEFDEEQKRNDIYDAFLMLVEIKHGSHGHNKFYVIQLLENPDVLNQNSKERNSLTERINFIRSITSVAPYVVYTRSLLPIACHLTVIVSSDAAFNADGEGWARCITGNVPITHTKSLQVLFRRQGDKREEFYDLSTAKAAFIAKFKEKTRNSWSERYEFKRDTKKYSFQLRYYPTKEKPAIKAKSALAKPIQELLEKATDKELMGRDLSGLNLDLKRLPVGQFSHTQIHEGYTILSTLAEHVTRLTFINSYRGQKVKECEDERKELDGLIDELTNHFYELIPHDYGSSTPPMINTTDAIKDRRDMLDVMSDINESMNYIHEDLLDLNGRARIDAIYQNLGAKISVIPKHTPEYNLIERYVTRTATQTPEIVNIFAVTRLEEVETFKDFVGAGKTIVEDNEGLRPSNLLLWHGTRLLNVAGILARGLKIAPPEAPSTGLMFGKGIYTADSFSKSLPYCGWSSGSDRFMFLCEVALGESSCLETSWYMEEPLRGTSSTKGVGRMRPDRSGLVLGPDGCGVPCGALQSAGEISGYLNYNEYIVYDANRVRLKYLLQFKA